MIVEVEEDLRDFATVYKKDYLGKKAERPDEYRPLPNYPPPLNILNGPYKQHLNTRRENNLLPESEQSEDPLNNLNRIRNRFPHLKSALPIVLPDENVIEREKKKLKKTVYQVDYLKEFDEYFPLRLDHFRTPVTLPQDWIIPETVQKRAYRNPWVIATKNLIKPPKILKPRNNLDPDHKEREILRVTTGNSEYISTIGATGEKIILRSPLDMKEHTGLQKPFESPEISESECSLILKQNLVLPSRIF